MGSVTSTIEAPSVCPVIAKRRPFVSYPQISLPSAVPEEPKSDKDTCENKFILLQSQHILFEICEGIKHKTVGLIGSVTSTIEAPSVCPVIAKRRPFVSYPQ